MVDDWSNENIKQTRNTAFTACDKYSFLAVILLKIICDDIKASWIGNIPYVAGNLYFQQKIFVFWEEHVIDAYVAGNLYFQQKIFVFWEEHVIDEGHIKKGK